MPNWSELLNELNSKFEGKTDHQREFYLKKLYEYTGRNVIVYFSGWLKNKKSNIDINDSDMTGFMTVINKLDASKGLDLILHTPGGYPTATEGIVDYLHSKFGNNIRVIVPHMAMSAGTMLACSSNTIIMGKHSSLGPIDPQFLGIPAYSIKEEFQKAKDDLASGSKNVDFWTIQLNKYPIAYSFIVDDAIKLSSELLKKWLNLYMFQGVDPKKKRVLINKVVKSLNTNAKSHSRHFNYANCVAMGLNIMPLESDQTFQDLVLSIYHACTITIDVTVVCKIIENQNGIRYLNFEG